ncbi:MAG: hypothetical protein SGI77_15600 [Pirellulaceae bacterium]|nr:hypothetical protein [Pirellulaceae bacterium]
MPKTLLLLSVLCISCSTTHAQLNTNPTTVATTSEPADKFDLFDYLGQVEPEQQERPVNQVLTLPDTLDQLSREQFGSRTPELEQSIRWLILKNIPPAYEDNRKWGLQKEVYDGFRFRREGLKIETERKYRTVKHGTWSRYYVELIEPDSRLVLQLNRLEMIAKDRLVFETTIEAPLHAFGRISQWQRNVQLISLSTNADAVVRIWVQAEVGMKTNPLVFPPEVQFEPVVKDAKVEATHFEVHRISQVSGPLAEQLGKGLRKVVDDRLEDYSEKLVIKMNQQLDKQHDKLKLSLGQEIESTFRQWTASAQTDR